MSLYFYRPKRSFGQGNIFTPVCHSVHSGGSGKENPPQAWRTPHHGEPPTMESPPRTRPPPSMETPPGMEKPSAMENPPRPDPPGPDTTPLAWRTPRTRPPMITPRHGEHPRAWRTPPQSRLRHTVYDRPVRILLECILVDKNICIISF